MSVAMRRLRTQHLLGPPLPGPADVVRHLGAVQAQDQAGAVWAIAQRCGVPTATAVGEALASGAILRTHILRPTWHLVCPEDIRWMLALTGPRVMAGSAARHRELGLDDATFSRTRPALESALSGGRALTRPDVAAVLTGAGIDIGGQRLAHLLGQAELAGVICSGPPEGKHPTHALLEERVPPAPVMGQDEALAELAVRYFSSHGPARLVDFTWWSSLTSAQARRGIEAAGDRLATEVVAGKPLWFSPIEPAGRDSSPRVRLLPNYDEYFVAYRDRGEFYDPTLDPIPVRGGVFANVVIVDGWVAGTWRRRQLARRIEVTIQPWTAWTSKVWDAVMPECAKLERHLGLPVTLASNAAG